MAVPVAETEVLPGPAPTPNANAAETGGLVAQAIQSLGQGFGQAGEQLSAVALKRQDLLNEAAASEADINFQTEVGKLEADYYSKSGKAAVDAFPEFQQNVAALRQQYLGTMTNPMAKNMLDRSMSYTVGRTIRSGASYSGTQAKNWMVQTSAARVENLIQQSAAHPNDDGWFAAADKAIKGEIAKQGEMTGASPEQVTEVQTAKGSEIRTARIAQLLQSDLDKAGQLFEQYKSDMTAQAQVEIGSKLGGREAKGFVQKLLLGTPEQQQQATTPPIVNGSVMWDAARVKAMEGGDYRYPHGGAYGQISAGVTGETPDKEQDNRFAQDWPKYGQDLEANLGRPVSGAEHYLAWNQGAAGAAALIGNPSAPASSLVPIQNIRDNLPDKMKPQAATMTAGAFMSYMNDRWNKTAPIQSAEMGQSDASRETSSGSMWAASLPPEEDAIASVQAQYGDQPAKLESGLAEISRIYHMADSINARQKKQNDTAIMALQGQMVKHAADPSQPDVDMAAEADDPMFQHDPDAYKQLVAFQRSLDSDKATSAVSSKTATGLFDKMNRAYGDPSKMLNPAEIMNERTAGHLKNSDYDWLMKQWNDGQTEEGQKLGQTEGDFLKGVKAQITRSNDITGLHSPTADMKYFNYIQWVRKRVGEKRQANEDPMTLFQYGSKDYVGSANALKPYQTTLQQQFQEMQNSFADAGTLGAGTPAVPEGQYKTLDDLKAAQKAGTIKYDEAVKYAKGQGWIQ